jgi:GNAT superfamily N-acetyltransferase
MRSRPSDCTENGRQNAIIHFPDMVLSPRSRICQGSRSASKPRAQVSKLHLATHLQLTPLRAADLPAATELSRDVQWPHRLEDWQFVLALGQRLVAYAGDRLVGAAMWWACEHAVTGIGMVLVDPKSQRTGIGRTLMGAVLDRIVTPAIVLNATDAGELLYRKLDFRSTAVINQHQGTSGAVGFAPANASGRLGATRLRASSISMPPPPEFGGRG